MFNSDFLSFKVTFPNKSYISENIDLKENKQNFIGNIVSDEDYFVIKMHKNLPQNITKSTQDKIQKIFDKFVYEYEFKREDIIEICNVRKSRASEIISLLLESDLIEYTEVAKYKFKK